MSFFSADYRAGFEAGLRDGRDGRPLGLFAEQKATPFGLGYRDGYQAGQVGPQDSYSDMISDLMEGFDLEGGGGTTENTPKV